MPAPLAIASCAQFAGTEREDLQVIAALRRRGIETAHAAWDDGAVDWSSFDLVVVRSTWDYPSRLQRVSGLGQSAPARSESPGHSEIGTRTSAI